MSALVDHGRAARDTGRGPGDGLARLTAREREILVPGVRDRRHATIRAHENRGVEPMASTR